MKILAILVVVAIFLSSGGIGTVKGCDENDDIVLEFSFPEPVMDSGKVVMDSFPNSGGLPVKPIRILLPQNKEVEDMEVRASNKISLGNGYSLEMNVSSQENFRKIGVHGFRGYSILFVNLYPVHYSDGELFYWKHMTLVIKIKDCPARDFRRLVRNEKIVRKVVDNPWCIDTYYPEPVVIINYSYEYVIITNEALKSADDEYTFQDLLDFKESKGLNSTIVTVEEIVNNSEYWVNGTWGDNNPSSPFYESEITANYSMYNDTQAKIRNFIRYANWEWGTDYVLLGGDADRHPNNEDDNIIPCRCLYANETGLPLNNGQFEEDDIPSDVYYACLDGNFNYDMDGHWGENASRNDIADEDEADLYADVWVGRACVDSGEEVSNFVMKTISYAQTHNSYLKEVLLLGEYLGFPGIAEWGGNYKDLIRPYIPNQYNISTLYDRDRPDDHWDAEELVEILNDATPHIINHDGHGFVHYGLRLHNSNILDLSNERYFFIYSHTCLAGSFDNGYEDTYYEQDCAAEYFTVETPHGAFAVIMNARYGLGSEDTLDSPSGRYDESFFEALFTENIRELGRANHHSKEDNVWQINENGMRWCYYETNLFGDPELKIKDPDISLSVNITRPKPGYLYLFDRELPLEFLEHPLIIGRVTVKVNATSDPVGAIENVEFYLDNDRKFIDEEAPYESKWRSWKFGKYLLKVVVNAKYGYKASDEIEILKFF